MPSRNVIKFDTPETFYHVYARGASKETIFRNTEDYKFFIKLFSRYLSKEPQESRLGPYPHLRGKVELLSFCLMNNHFHMLIYQNDKSYMAALMKCVMTSYSRYFNTKYGRTGPVFETRYKAAKIDDPSYFTHVSRYIHLNPRYYKNYKYSSYRSIVDNDHEDWLQPERIMEEFDSVSEFKEFTQDYENRRNDLTDIKSYIAG